MARRGTGRLLGWIAGVALATQGGAAFAQLNHQGNPNFGTRTLAPGFMPDPVRINNITSGGNISVASLALGPGCTGWATSQPDFRINMTGNSGSLRVYVEAGSDTTLIVNDARGNWRCNDDSYGTTNPTVDLPNGGPGQYDIWVGSYSQGQQARSTLIITEIQSNHPGATAAATGVRPSGGGGLNTNGRPNFGARSIAPGFMPDPIVIPVTSGGNLNVSQMGLGQGCVGWATSQPDFRFNLTGASNNLRVYFLGGGDTTLVINRANSQWSCNDDSWGGTNPTIDLGYAQPGQYDVWVGSYGQGQQAQGSLYVTEISSNHP